MAPYGAVPGAGTWQQMEPEGPNPSGVLVLGLNPGLQHILRLRALDLGQDGCVVFGFDALLPSKTIEQSVTDSYFLGGF